MFTSVMNAVLLCLTGNRHAFELFHLGKSVQYLPSSLGLEWPVQLHSATNCPGDLAQIIFQCVRLR